MDLGTGLAIGTSACGVCASIAAVIITAIKVKGGTVHKETEVCPLHSGINTMMETLRDRMDIVEETIREGFNALHKDIKDILMKI